MVIFDEAKLVFNILAVFKMGFSGKDLSFLLSCEREKCFIIEITVVEGVETKDSQQPGKFPQHHIGYEFYFLHL